MIVDTSALVAILKNEPEARRFSEILLAPGKNYVSAPTFLELNMVLLSNKVEEALRKIARSCDVLGLEIIAFTPEMADVAAMAFLKYGKGRGHSAQLNFGDCISYAVSKVEMMPLLFKGDDFRLTDVECALPASV